jgi:type IV pilus assembly protein PilC
VNLVEAGEQAGALETLLDKIATYKEKTEALKKKVKKALFYPAAVMVVAVVVTVILLIFVIPQFESLFKGFGADLPAFTQFVIDMSRGLQNNWRVLRRRGAGADLRVLLLQEALEGRCASSSTAPCSSSRSSAPSCTSRPIARFRAHAVDHVRGRRAAGRSPRIRGRRLRQHRVRDAVMKMRDEVATGQRLQRAMENTGLFPNMVIQMIAVGEEAGALDAMSGKVATFYEAEVDNAGGQHVLAARTADHGHPRRAGRRPGHRHVPAHLQAGRGGVRSPSVTTRNAKRRAHSSREGRGVSF